MTYVGRFVIIKTGDFMDCKETERRISRFLANDLTGRELIQFIEHVESCESCKEELTIQYLSSEGIARLEEGKTFDLDRELTEYMHTTVRKYKLRRKIRFCILVLEILAILIIAGVFAYALL